MTDTPKTLGVVFKVCINVPVYYDPETQQARRNADIDGRIYLRGALQQLDVDYDEDIETVCFLHDGEVYEDV